MTDTTIPLLPCVSPDETLDFFGALGFELTYKQTRPYLYLAFRRGEVELHYGKAPSGLDPAEETSGGCLVMTDDVAGLSPRLHRRAARPLRQGAGEGEAPDHPIPARADPLHRDRPVRQQHRLHQH